MLFGYIIAGILAFIVFSFILKAVKFTFKLILFLFLTALIVYLLKYCAPFLF